MVPAFVPGGSRAFRQRQEQLNSRQPSRCEFLCLQLMDRDLKPYSRSPDCQPVPGYHAASAHFRRGSPAPPIVPSSTQNLCPEESLQEEQDLP